MDGEPHQHGDHVRPERAGQGAESDLRDRTRHQEEHADRRQPEDPEHQSHDAVEEGSQRVDRRASGVADRRQCESEQEGEDDDAERPTVRELREEVLRDHLLQDVHPRTAESLLVRGAHRVSETAVLLVLRRPFTLETGDRLRREAFARGEAGHEHRTEHDRGDHGREVVEERGATDDAQTRRIADRGHPHHHGEEDQGQHQQHERPDQHDLPDRHPGVAGLDRVGDRTVEDLPEDRTAHESHQNQHRDQAVLLHGWTLSRSRWSERSVQCTPCSASQRSASIAARQPMPAAVIACRYT